MGAGFLLAACVHANPGLDCMPPHLPPDLNSLDSTINVYGMVVHKNLIMVGFKPEASRSAKQEVIKRVNGRIAGCTYRYLDHLDAYYIRIPSSQGVLRASSLAREHPSVGAAMTVSWGPIGFP